MKFKGTELSIGDLIFVKTTLSHHPDNIVMLRIDEIDEPFPIAKYADDSGRGDIINGIGGGHVGFYCSQIQRLATEEEKKNAPPKKKSGDVCRYNGHKIKVKA